MSDSELSNIELSEGYISQDESAEQSPFEDDDMDDMDMDEDFEEEEEEEAPKRKVSLKLKLPVRVETPRKANTQPAKRAPSGRSKKVSYNYYEDTFDDEDEDVIPTPDLYAEGLSDDDATPHPTDITKLTERQRSRLFQEEHTPDTQLVSLSSKSRKRVLTEEENNLRKAEIARKRKNITDRKLEEEKQDTINKLLKRRAGKSTVKDEEWDDETPRDKQRRPYLQHRALLTYVSKRDVQLLRVPAPLL